MFIKNELVSVNFKVMLIFFGGRIWSNVYPLDSTHFIFFAGLHWHMLENWINIYNLCYNAVDLKRKW